MDLRPLQVEKNLISRSITKLQWQKFLLQMSFLVEVPEEHVFCCCLVAQSYLTLGGPTDCNLPGSSVHRIFQARILEWVAFSYSKGIFLTQGLNSSTYIASTYIASTYIDRFFPLMPLYSAQHRECLRFFFEK